MIQLAWPWVALLLPLPWLYYRMRGVAASASAAIFLPFAATIGAVGGRATASTIARHLVFALLWILLVLSAMRPQWLGDPLPMPTTGRRIILAVDVSGSMSTQDMANNASRLQVVQQVAGKFIDGRQGDQVGLILFGTQPYVQAPLTQDLVTVHRFLDEAVVGVAGPGNSDRRCDRHGDQAPAGRGARGAGASAGATGARQHGADPADRRPEQCRCIIQPVQAAQALRPRRDCASTPSASAPPQRKGFFGLSGNNDLDEATLQQIARITGGQYFRATDASALQSVYRQIEKLEPVAAHARSGCGLSTNGSGTHSVPRCC
jgi:Ca-activated chloride channel homolog